MNTRKKTKLKEVDLDKLVEENIQSLNDKDLPEVIIGQFNKLNRLEELNKESKKAADSARENANNAKNKAVGWFNKKDRIEDLQEVCSELAEAVQTLTVTQEASFGHHSELAEISKYLFGIGVSNISANRFVVRELELRLKGASEEELSDLARQELTTVVKQLKAQEDILKKQEQFAKHIKSHDDDITELFHKNQEYDELIIFQSKKIKEVEEKIILNAKRLITELENVNDVLKRKVAELDFKMLNIKDEIQSIKTSADSKFISCKAALDENHNSLLIYSYNQKKKIKLLVAFLVINFILVVVLAYYAL